MSETVSFKSGRRRRLSCALLLGACFAACSRDGSDPLAPYRNQALSWHACDASSLGDEDAALLQVLSPRARCAEVRAPLDYGDPGKGELTIAVLRVEASAPSRRRGSIIVNPGGPGLDGLPYALRLGAYWISTGTTDPEVLPLYAQLAQEFDLVGFSPRGTGSSTRLDCTPERPWLFVADPTRVLSPENTGNALENGRTIAEACANAPLTPFIDTDTTARDLDLLRHLLHDERLDYIGMSYGTWLGYRYATLFPERVGHMLLSGVTDFSEPLGHQILTQAGGMQRVLDEVLVPYAVRYPERFGHLAADAAELRAMLDALDDDLHYATMHALEESGAIAQSTLADLGVVTLLAATVIAEELASAPDVNEADLQDRMTHRVFVSDPDLDAQAHTAAAALVGSVFRQRAQIPEADVEGMFWAIVCNDSGSDVSPAEWVREGDRSAELYPDFGGLKRENPCLYWSPAPAPRPPPRPITAAIVLLQSELDPLTVLAGARNSLALAPAASFIRIDGEYAHAPLPPYGNRCVDEPIARYLLDGTQPPREASCPRRPLPAER